MKAGNESLEKASEAKDRKECKRSSGEELIWWRTGRWDYAVRKQNLNAELDGICAFEFGPARPDVPKKSYVLVSLWLDLP